MNRLRVVSLALALLSRIALPSAAEAQSPARGPHLAPTTPVPPNGRPSLMPPVHFLLAPGAVTLAIGGILWTRVEPDEDRPALYNASTILMGTGAAMVLGTIPYLGSRLARQRRWDAERRWAACKQRCATEAPKLYYAASMLVPGVLLTAAGFGALFQDWQLVESSGDMPGDPDLGHSGAYILTAAACATVGTTLLIAGTVHLVARMRLRAAWARHHDAASEIRVAPMVGARPGATLGYPLGLMTSGRF